VAEICLLGGLEILFRPPNEKNPAGGLPQKYWVGTAKLISANISAWDLVTSSRLFATGARWMKGTGPFGTLRASRPTRSWTYPPSKIERAQSPCHKPATSAILAMGAQVVSGRPAVDEVNPRRAIVVRPELSAHPFLRGCAAIAVHLSVDSTATRRRHSPRKE
jgi:hypothetical protein